MMGTIYLITASLIWGVLHSVLASHTFKHQLRLWFGSMVYFRIYRLSYNLFAIASLFPIALILVTFPDQTLYSIPAPWVYLTSLGQGLAVIALIAGVMQTGPLEFAGLSQLSSSYADLPPAGLVVSGLYAYVRHPLYSAGLMFIWLTPEMSINRLVLWIVFSVYIIIGAYFEERKLLIDFGSAYLEYRARTPMLIPLLRKQA